MGCVYTSDDNENRSDKSDIEFDVETCSEVYKESIRCGAYGDTIEDYTRENMIFIYKDKKYKMYFDLQFSFNFEDGFIHTYFTNFELNEWIKPSVKKEMEKYIRQNFVTEDRLSC